MDLLPCEFARADFLFWLTLGWHVLIGEPVSVHDSISEDVGLLCQHSVGDVIEVEEVAEKISNNAHAPGRAVRVAPSG